MTLRNQAVAGQFYPGSRNALLREVESLIDSNAVKVRAIGAVSPHAGYVYSGAVAGRVLSMIEPKKTCIIIGPNHTGMGSRFGLDTNSSWNTPLGDVEIDKAFAQALKRNTPLVQDDILSHMHEHSIEVQLPFLQVLDNDFRFVPITVSYASLEEYREIGAAVALTAKGLAMERDIVIIASSDMTHYETQESAAKKDRAAIDALLALDEKGLLDAVAKLDISMCGCAPAAIMLVASKALGAKEGRLVRYLTSGDTSGDYSSVVGYAGVIIT